MSKQKVCRHKETRCLIVYANQLKHSTIDEIMKAAIDRLPATMTVTPTDAYTDPCGEDGPYLFMRVDAFGGKITHVKHGDVIIIDEHSVCTAISPDEFESMYELCDD